MEETSDNSRGPYEDYTYATPLTVLAMTDGRHISCIEAGDDPDCAIGNCPEPICWVCGEIWPCDKAGEQ